MRSVRLASSLIALVGLCVWPATASGQVDWPTYGGNAWNQRWSNLKQINTGNVDRLVPRMVFQTNVSRLGSFENTPVVVGNMMYVTTAYNEATIAYDLASRKQVWRYDYKLSTALVCCGPNNRGVAVSDGLVFEGTMDAHLIALDSKTGELQWDIQVADPAAGYSITAAPLVIGDNVIVGVSGGEYGIRGHATAYNTRTGDQVWRWYSIPGPKGDPTFDEKAPNGWWGTWATKAEDSDLHRDIAKEKADSAKYPTPGRPVAVVWTTPAYDKDLNSIFLVVGNPSPTSMVASARRQSLHRCHRGHRRHQRQDQVVLPNDPARRLGPRRRISRRRYHAGRQEGRSPCRKTGWVYVVDAVTGKLVRKSQNFVPQENMFALPTRRAPGCSRARTVARSGRPSPSTRISTMPSWPACTSR